jgi:dGTPase
MTFTKATREQAEELERQLLSPWATFSGDHWERPQPEKPDPYRTCFVRDRDRVLHCGAFRRLKDKTQVFVIDEGDFYRTRLTHTLEVSQLSRFLCQALRLNATLGEVLALVHDIGHPPFGHEGERILNACTDVDFDHNQQALRIVDILESPYLDRRGLNLTHVARRMILKHGGDAGRGADPTVGHVLEAQVADLADSTAYQHHDVEDGLRAGILVPGELTETSIWRQAVEEVGGLAEGPQGTKRVLNHMLKTSLYDVLTESSRRIETTELGGAMEIAAKGQEVVSYSPERGQQHIELGQFLYDCYYRHPRVLRSAASAQQAIALIVEHYRTRTSELPADYRSRLESDGVERTICDYVAGMTDRFAVEEWRRLAAARSVVSLSPPPLEQDLASKVTALEETIGYTFRDKSLAATALTHASARSDERAPNERLEFLGDAVLGLVVGQELYLRFPDRPEGELSRMKSITVSRNALQTVAAGWELAELLVLGPGFRRPEDAPPSVAADGVEAVLGAIFLDGHLEPARRIILAEFLQILEAAADGRRGRNAKSELQSFTQAELGATPNYRVLAEEGPDHRKSFTVAAVVRDVRLSMATGRNKRQAEQRAAREALHMLRSAQEGRVPPPEGLAELMQGNEAEPENEPEVGNTKDQELPGASKS